MPELPEVETIRRQIEPDLTGRTIEAVEILDPYFTKPETPSKFEAAVEGREITGAGRRGKYLMLEFDDGRYRRLFDRQSGTLAELPELIE
mgnify:CR=1 FL=1